MTYAEALAVQLKLGIITQDEYDRAVEGFRSEGKLFQSLPEPANNFWSHKKIEAEV